MKLSEFYLAVDDCSCVMCKRILSPWTVKCYEHSDGWTVDGFEKKQWIYYVCTSCGYQNAISKLGYPREDGSKKDGG